jgi:hypothetical protein
MIYTYQDGTELQVQRDFIQDLRNYVECLEKVLPLEKDIIELKDQEKEQTAIYERKVSVLGGFKDNLHRYMPVNRDTEEAQILEPCVNEIYNVCDKFIRKTREEYENEMSRIKKDAGAQTKHKEYEVIKALNPFLISSVYGAKRIYDIAYSEQGLTGTLYCYFSGLQFNYKLNFSDDKLTVQKLIGDLNMPHMTKTGLFTKEQKPRMINLSDFMVLSIQYDDLYNFSLDLENKKRIIRIVRKNGNFSVLDDGQDITADDDLAGLVEDAELQKIPKKIIEYIKKSVSSFDLKDVLIDDEDAIASNSVFDCMKIIAGQYGVIVSECIRRSTVKNEISIKIKMEDGTRSEKYISKEDLYSSLANIGGEGLEIASIIGVDPKEKSKANNKYFIV